MSAHELFADIESGRRKYPPYEGEVAAPPHFMEMRRIAEALAGDEVFLRVDLYNVGRPVFGELTLHPDAGQMAFNPAVWDARFGSLM